MSTKAAMAIAAVFLALSDDFAQVIGREVVGRVGPHVQVLDAEVNRVGAVLYGSCKALV